MWEIKDPRKNSARYFGTSLAPLRPSRVGRSFSPSSNVISFECKHHLPPLAPPPFFRCRDFFHFRQCFPRRGGGGGKGGNVRDLFFCVFEPRGEKRRRRQHVPLDGLTTISPPKKKKTLSNISFLAPPSSKLLFPYLCWWHDFVHDPAQYVRMGECFTSSGFVERKREKRCEARDVFYCPLLLLSLPQHDSSSARREKRRRGKRV